MEDMLTLLDSIQSDGRLTVEINEWVAQCRDLKRSERAKRLLELAFMDSPYNVLITRSPTFRKRLDVKIEREPVGRTLSEPNNKWALSFNAVVLLGLPGLKTVSEAAEVRDFLWSWRAEYERYANHRPLVQIYRMAGTKGIEFHIGEDPMYPAAPYLTFPEVEAAKAAVTSRLVAEVAASPVLQAFVAQVHASIGKMGPHSWFNYRGEHLFGRMADPVTKFSLEQIRNEKP